ncbi:MAG: undecaprenyldiphospho-muramoylpentapeptide beta-N-acetylglucosaminyltransferase [Elusimicrobia bacterium]|nr:undecaprenyldiphospho-muramoylpentapeptide beta-N-acetylglucosaminyltransferase [Elusimicrobiota bacterium]
MPSQRIVIAAGGTGGHFYPGLALARALRERGWQVLFVLRRDESAARTLEAENIPSVEIELSGLPRKPSKLWLSLPFRLLSAMLLLRRVLRDFRPSVVLGMGGYLTVPLVLAAAVAGVPRAVHESNAVLGLANRLASLLGARLLWGLVARGGAGHLTGTPIRSSLWKSAATDRARTALSLEPELPTLLVFGGSQGARALNLKVPAALRQAAKGRSFQVLHLTGRSDPEPTRRAYSGASFPAQVRSYLEEMYLAYGAADLVLCRAGASTLAELAAQMKPAVLVPYPYATGNHQQANARVLESVGAATVLPEGELPGRLPVLIRDLLAGAQAGARRTAMARSYARLGLPSAELTVSTMIQALEVLANP